MRRGQSFELLMRGGNRGERGGVGEEEEKEKRWDRMRWSEEEGETS